MRKLFRKKLSLITHSITTTSHNMCSRLHKNTKQSAVHRHISKQSAQGKTQPRRKVTDVDFITLIVHFISRYSFLFDKMNCLDLRLTTEG